MSSVLIEARALAFASFAVNPECPRFHLRGVRVEYRDGHAVCIGTDGVVLLFARSSYETAPFEPFTLNFRKSGRLFVTCRKMGPMVTIEVSENGEAIWRLLRSNGSVIERGFVEQIDAFEAFPEWRFLLPESPLHPAAIPVGVHPMPLRWICRAVDNYQGDAPCTLRLVSPGAELPVVVLLESEPNVGGLILPAFQDLNAEIVFPDWTMHAKAPAGEDKVEVTEDAA